MSIVQVATNLPVVIAGQKSTPTNEPKKQQRPDNTLDESNLSNLYNRIMSEHNAPQIDTNKKATPPVITNEERKEEVSMVSEFNPPTQKMGTSIVIG
jgi:hypothetical protein